jgi:uncharacterized protein involved in cysteine biosynthesis
MSAVHQPAVDHSHARIVDRTNRLSESLVRTLLFLAVFAHVIVVVDFVSYLWTAFSPGVGLSAACVVSASWVAWLRAVEFNRAFPRDEDRDPPDRFRRHG